MTIITVLMSCHNRRVKTLTCLRNLYSATLPANTVLKVILLDDGSTDDTATAVRSEFPGVQVLQGDGSLYWCRSMLLAWKQAYQANTDYVLWLNDDTYLYPHSIIALLETAGRLHNETGKPGIVVGSTDNDNGHMSYGGAVPISTMNRLMTRKVEPRDEPQPAVTMNGNCVLVPRAVYERIGMLDGVFQHAMGDIDYGFRTQKAGFPIWVMPGYAGRCNNDHEVKGTFRDSELTLRERWRKITSPKGLPFFDWFVLCQRHAGPLWPLVWLLPYAKVLLGLGLHSKSSLEKK